MLKVLSVHILLFISLSFISFVGPLYTLTELVSATPEITKKLTKTRKVEKNIPKKIKEKIVDELDFTPSKTLERASSKEKKNIDNTKITFKEVKKLRPQKIKIIAKPTELKVRPIERTKVESNTYELSYRDIENTNQPIKTKQKLQKTAWVKIDLSNLNPAKRIAQKEKLKSNKSKLKKITSSKAKFDRISTVSAATEKSRENLPTEENQYATDSDELVFFDYSEDGKVRTEEVALKPEIILDESPKDSGISEAKTIISNVAIPGAKVNTQKSNDKKSKAKGPFLDRTKKISPAAKRIADAGSAAPTINADKDGFAKGDDPLESAIKGLQKDIQQENEVDYGCLEQEELSKKRRSFESDYSVELTSIGLNTQNFDNITNFEIRFLDDIDDIVKDFGTGRAKLKYKLNSPMNIRRGIVYSAYHYPTTYDFIFEGFKSSFSIPVFEKEKFETYINELGVSDSGAHLLVELDKKTEDVELEINTPYNAKVFLDRDYNLVNRADSDYAFILFIGVDSGNTQINFMDINNQISSKTLYLGAGEIYYEPNFYAQIDSDELRLYEEGLRSKCLKMLDIKSDEITPWSFKNSMNKESLNIHTVGKMIYPLGTRKYYELKHLGKSIIVGKWDEDELIIPSADYADNILNSFDVQEGECLIQLNVTKPILSSYLNALSSQNYMQTNMRFLDENGSFYEEVSDKTNRIFIHGQQEGVVNIKLNYIDGSSQFVQTFCGKDDYLVEQL